MQSFHLTQMNLSADFSSIHASVCEKNFTGRVRQEVNFNTSNTTVAGGDNCTTCRLWHNTVDMYFIKGRNKEHAFIILYGNIYVYIYTHTHM